MRMMPGLAICGLVVVNFASNVFFLVSFVFYLVWMAVVEVPFVKAAIAGLPKIVVRAMAGLPYLLELAWLLNVIIVGKSPINKTM